MFHPRIVTLSLTLCVAACGSSSQSDAPADGAASPTDSGADLDSTADSAPSTDTATAADTTTDGEAGPTTDGMTPTCGPDARPNDGSGCWADSSNTGYAHAPDYPGSLTDFPINKGTYILLDSSYDGKTLSFYRFKAKVMIATTGVKTIHFHGCSFETNLVNDIDVYDWASEKSTYSYCTFKPSAVTKPPVSCAASYQIAINQSATQALTVDHCDIWGMGNGIQFGDSSKDHPLEFTNNYIHDAADTDDAGGCGYHHDGIGPCSDGGISYVTMHHNTIVSVGNTNGIALQGYKPYDHITVTNNFISGWGYAVSFGAGMTAASDTNMVVTDNVFSGQLPSLYGPYYGTIPLKAAKGNSWRRNRYQVKAGDAWGDKSLDGEYWWPSDDTGHATDYAE